MKAKIVRVDWTDAFHSGGWETLPYDPPDVTQSTVGFLIRKDKRVVCLAQSIDDQDLQRAADIMVIPIAWVKRVTVLGKN